MPNYMARKLRVVIVMLAYKSAMLTIARRLPGATLQVFWHGTSSRNLRSILVNGLDPTKIKEGNWIIDKTTNEINPSKISYGGIYYAKEFGKAKSYADELCRKFNSSKTAAADTKVHPLVIAVQLQELSTLPDEDNYGIHHIFSEFIGQNDTKAAQILVMLVARTVLRTYNDKFSWRNWLEQFRQRVMERLGFTIDDLNKRQDKARVLGAIDAMLLTLCRRFLAHTQVRPGKSSWSGGYAEIRKALRDYAPKLAERFTNNDAEHYQLNLPKEFRLPSAAEGERKAAKAIDYFIHLTRDLGRRGQLSGGWRTNTRTLRSKNVVGFHGRNKILCIMEFVGETGWAVTPFPEHEVIKLHYGKPPESFITQYRERVGKRPIIYLDKSGKQIGSVPSAEASLLGKGLHLFTAISQFTSKGNSTMPDNNSAATEYFTRSATTFTGVPPANEELDFPGIPTELAMEIAQRMCDEKQLGRVPSMVSHALTVIGRDDLLKVIARSQEFVAKNKGRLPAAHKHLIDNGYKLHHKESGKRVYQHDTRPHDYIHIYHTGKTINAAYRETSPHTTTARASPIKGYGHTKKKIKQKKF